MRDALRTSVIICGNMSGAVRGGEQGRFLRETIDSALNQTYENIEVIVADEGVHGGSAGTSQDGIAAGYAADRVLGSRSAGAGPVPVPAWQAGFQRSGGDVVLFLEAGDVLLPSAVEKAIRHFGAPAVVQVQWPLWGIDTRGRMAGRLLPASSATEGDLRDLVLRDGPQDYDSPPTTGNAWSRRFLDKALAPEPFTPEPAAPEGEDAAAFLATLAPMFGTVQTIDEPQGCYRAHAGNDYGCMPLYDRNRRLVRRYDYRCRVLSSYLLSAGIPADPQVWRQRNKGFALMERSLAAAEEIAALVPAGNTFAVVDEGLWEGPLFSDRQGLRFRERGGQDWGPPPDDETAITDLERLRQKGATFLVFAWPAFWWLEYYAGLHRHLRANFRCALENDRLVAFDLRA